MEQKTIEWCLKHLRNLFNGESPTVYFAFGETLEVNTGYLNDCNMEYCKKNNIPVYNVLRNGGTVVTCDGTIAFEMVNDVKNGLQSVEFLKSFIIFLKDKGISAKIDHNDVLIDKYKVASVVEDRVPIDKTKLYSFYLISYNVDIEAIRNICLKETNKEPKGLSEFGLDKEELITWLKNYFNNLEESLK